MEYNTLIKMNYNSHNVVVSHEHNIASKKPETKAYILYDSIYLNCKNRQNKSMIYIYSVYKYIS